MFLIPVSKESVQKMLFCSCSEVFDRGERDVGDLRPHPIRGRGETSEDNFGGALKRMEKSRKRGRGWEELVGWVGWVVCWLGEWGNGRGLEDHERSLFFLERWWNKKKMQKIFVGTGVAFVFLSMSTI